MTDVVIFGGTTEGRELAEFCSRTWTPTLVCVATELGEQVAPELRCVTYHTGRLGREEMAGLVRENAPRIVVDATHPYAAEVTGNVAAVCAELGLAHVRVRRPGGDTESGERGSEKDIRTFPDIGAAIVWLNTTAGTIFSTTGAKEAAALTAVEGFRERVVLRILPLAQGIAECQALGYPSSRIVAMQGPFGRDLNAALFRHFGASILLTKDSGDVGGFGDKLAAARDCGMTTAVITRPTDVDGVGVEEAERLITKAVLGA